MDAGVLADGGGNPPAAYRGPGCDKLLTDTTCLHFCYSQLFPLYRSPSPFTMALARTTVRSGVAQRASVSRSRVVRVAAVQKGTRITYIAFDVVELVGNPSWTVPVTLKQTHCRALT